MKTYLVLEGGGMRGAYTAGVLDCFMDLSISFLDIVGVSAGVCNDSSYVSNQYKRSYDVLKTFSQDKRYLSVENLVKTGSAFGTTFIFDTIPNQLMPFDYPAFKDSSVSLRAVCTNLETGMPAYFKVNDLKKDINLMIASCALPLISKGVTIDKDVYYDGGVADPIPIEYALYHSDFQVAVLTRPKGYRKRKLLSSRIASTRYIHHKSFSKALRQRSEVYNRSLERLEDLAQQNKALIIRPSKDLGLNRFEKDFSKLEELYYMGYSDALKHKEQLLEVIKASKNVIRTEKNDNF